MSKYQLDDGNMCRLRAGEIVALDDQYTFLQHIPSSHYVLSVLDNLVSNALRYAH